jgi:septal ring-binding cell division protein DamX
VSAVETPPPAVEQRRCPRCGSELTAEQEWCLECGAGVATTVVGPPSWRGPAAIVGVLLAIAAAALILALVELAGDAEQVAEQPPAPTQQAAPVAPTQTPVSTPTPPPDTTTIPPSTESGGTSSVAEWPAGTEGWTVVLESSSTEEAAEARAQELAQQGISVGMLNSDDFGSLEPGRYVVFSGQYDSRRAADQALASLSGQVEGAYVRRVAPE